ncbi:MAG TPA: esterase-like activity of phytase family protein [Sphingomicrobium sp.]|nr:esterase-like activity of phytase family protein [Sphingomicrobium sp.]
MSIFSALLLGLLVAVAYPPMRAPDRAVGHSVRVELVYQPIALPSGDYRLPLAGAWRLSASDPRLGGLSALAVDHGRFLAVSDLGTVARFDPPSAKDPRVDLVDLEDGPGPIGFKDSRDAESLAPDARGRGWWIGYEQRHSLWLYDADFRQAAAIDLKRPRWSDNRGAEALLADRQKLLVLHENGAEALAIGAAGIDQVELFAGAGIAEAARAPDGSAWLLLRSRGAGGIDQWIAPLVRNGQVYRAGPRLELPKAAWDNYEGMAITPRPGGGWRFWLVTDDGHRFMARTLLVAVDLLDSPRPRHYKSPVKITGPSRNSAVEK